MEGRACRQRFNEGGGLIRPPPTEINFRVRSPRPRHSLVWIPTTNKSGVSRRAAARLVRGGAELFPALPKAQSRPSQGKTTQNALARVRPGGSESSRTWSNVVQSRGREAVARDISCYSQMLLNPFDKAFACRYPDETIASTALTHLTTSNTHVVGASGNLYTMLFSKVIRSDGVTPGVYNTPVISIATPVGSPLSPFDYGGPQTGWLAVDAVDRTLACAIRVRLVGLPASTFLPSGTLYFLQLQQDEYAAFIGSATEPLCLQAVTAGKGFTMTVNELSKLDGAQVPLLPQGPMSFLFSDVNSAQAYASGSSPGFLPGVVSANPVIAIFAFGCLPGQTFRFDYAHHIEYIPSPTAAGLIPTKTEPPSQEARQGIARASQLVQQRIGGAMNGSSVAGLVAGTPNGGLLSMLGKAAVGMIPGGAIIARGASALASGLGAPSWLTSALSSLA